MDDRKLLSLQEIVADIHRSAEEIDEHCGRSGTSAGDGDSNVNEQTAGRSVTAAPYAISDGDSESIGLPAVTSVSFDIKSEPHQGDDIDEILEDLENYEDIGLAKKLQRNLDNSPMEVIKSHTEIMTVSPTTSAKINDEVPLFRSDSTAVPVVDVVSAAVAEDLQCMQAGHDAIVAVPHPTFSKIESLISRTLSDSNMCKSEGSETLHAPDDRAEGQRLSDKNDPSLVLEESHSSVISPTPQQPPHDLIDRGSSNTESNDNRILDCNSNPPSPEKPDNCVDPTKSNDSSNEPESDQRSDENILEDIQPYSVDSEAQMTNVDCQDDAPAECEISSKNSLDPMPIQSNSQRNETDAVASSSKDVTSAINTAAVHDATDDSIMTLQDIVHNETADDSTSDLTRHRDTTPSRLNLQSENAAKSQNSPVEDCELENTSSISCNAHDSSLHDSLMCSKESSQNQIDNELTDPVMSDEEYENLEEELHGGENDDVPLEFTYAFKKDIANYVKKHRSISKAVKHFGIPFGTINVWLRKLYKGASDDWIDELTDEGPIGETVYTERFKNAVVDYVKRRRCSIEYAAETLNVDADDIRNWRDNANKEKRQAILSSIPNRQLLERLGLDLHDIRRRRVAEEGQKSESTDIPDQSEGYSDEFILSVVRYVKRRKCSIERASKTLNIPGGILRSWIVSMKDKLKSESSTPKEKNLHIWPQSDSLLNESVGEGPSLVNNASGDHSTPNRRIVLWSRKQNSSQISGKHYQDRRHILQRPSGGRTLKATLLNRGFNDFKRCVLGHARRTNSSVLTAQHFGLPANTVYEWAKQDDLELENAPAGQSACSEEFVEAVRAFVKKRKCSLIFAADLFKINPKWITTWKRKTAEPSMSNVSDDLPSTSSSHHSATASTTTHPQPVPTSQEFKRSKANQSGTGAVVEKWLPENNNTDPDEFLMCCDELFPEGQSQNRYSKAFRVNVMRHLVLKNIGVSETAALFHMPRRTVYDWLLRWSEIKIRIQKRQQGKESKIQTKAPSTPIAHAEMVDVSHSCFVDEIAEISTDSEAGSNHGIPAPEPESSSDDPDYDPSTGDLNDNERRKMKKKIHKRRSHDVLSSAQYLMPHDRIPAHLGVSTEERVSSENFSDKTATILNESPKYAHLREIVNEAAQQTLVDPSKKSEDSVRVLEERLEKWIREQVALSRTVKLSTVKFYALQFAAQLKIVDFTLTPAWCVNFLHRTSLRSSITYDLNLTMPDKPVDDVGAGTSEYGETKGSNAKTKGHGKKRITSLAEVTDRIQRQRFRRERSSIVPLPPDMLQNRAGSKPQLPRSDYDHGAQSSNHDATRYVVLKKPPPNEEEKTQATAKQLQINSANGSLISMREQRFRSRVVAYARKHGIDAAAKNYKIAEKDVRKWMGCDTSQPANSGIGISSSQRYVTIASTKVRGGNTVKILSVEKSRSSTLKKSSLPTFQGQGKPRNPMKRKSSDSMTSIGKAFSLDVAKSLKLSDDVPTGAEAKKKFFYLIQDRVFLDHAGKGSRLRKSLKLSHTCHEHIESQPHFFYRKQFLSHIQSLQKRFAEFIGSDPAHFIFIDTVRSGMDTVLRDLQLTHRSTIYYLNFSSVETKNAITHICENTGCRAQEELLLLPLQSQEDILSVISETLHEETSLAVFDHCPVDFGFMLPVKEITLLCHMKGVPVLINGSHGVGQDSLNLSYLGSDFYVGSCDQWLCSVKGCSFLYMKKEKQDELYRGNGNVDSPFQAEYSPKDPNELSSCMALIPALNFWDSLGNDDIRIYCQCLLKTAIELFQSRWEAELLAPFNMHGMICCVSLPSSLFDDGVSDISTQARLIEDQLYNEYKIDAPIVCVQNKLYVRISVHVYNHLADFEKLANAIVEMEADST